MAPSSQPQNQPEWDVRTRLRAVYPRLRPAAQRVASLLLEQGERFPDFTLAQLCDEAGVTSSAVIHMCQAMGLSGFREFRTRWVQDMASRSALSGTDTVLFSDLYPELVTTEKLLLPNIHVAAEQIARAKQVFIFGSLGSGLVAQLGAEGLARVGRMAITFPSDERITWAYFDVDTVVIVVSHRGQNPALGEAMEHARSVGARTILMTGRPHSPLADLADIVLLTAAPGGPEAKPSNSVVRAVQVAAMHALVQAVAAKLRTGAPHDQRPTDGP